MFNDYEIGVLKAHKVNPEDVQSIDTHEIWVTFKDGTKRRLVECWTRKPNMRVLKNSSKR